MKKIIFVSFIISLLVVSPHWAQAARPQPDTSVTPSSIQKAERLPAATIDGIEVPYEVLTFAQLRYQGYAVTQAKKVMDDGSMRYQLRVDQDIVPDDSNSIYLLYDLNWKLVAERAALSAPRQTAPPRPRERADDTETEPPEAPREGQRRQEQGGRGRGERRHNRDENTHEDEREENSGNDEYDEDDAQPETNEEPPESSDPGGDDSE